MKKRWAIAAGIILSLVVAALVLAQGGGSSVCPPGCTFVCVQPMPDCGCYGYCDCPPAGTPVPTPTPAPGPGRWCARYRYQCDWQCSDYALGQLNLYYEIVDCVTGQEKATLLVSTAPCGSCRRLRDCRVPGACTPTPPRWQTPTPRPTATPPPCSCPTPQEILGTPSYQAAQWPPYPIVVGQGGSGITVRLTVTLPDWVLRQWRQESRQVCVPGAAGPGQTACTMPDGRPGHSEWRDGECVDCGSDNPCRGVNGCGNQCWSPFCASWDETYAEYATGGTIRLQLRQSSIDWIQSELATRYPGAHVYQATWEAQARVIATYDLGNATACVLEAYFPVRDPGYYDVSAVIATSKRTLTYQSPQPVSAYLIDTSIIR